MFVIPGPETTILYFESVVFDLWKSTLHSLGRVSILIFYCILFSLFLVALGDKIAPKSFFRFC